MKGREIISVLILMILLICGFSGAMLSVHADDIGQGSSAETEDSSMEAEGEQKLANQVISIENGTIVKEDGSIEYGSPEEGQEYIESSAEPLEESVEYFDRYAYQPSAYQAVPMAETVTDMTANIRKRTQWTDKSNGDGKVTLQYASDSGRIQGMKDMNVVLIQDKSGSMDANYGYNLEVVRQGWGSLSDVRNYPIQNSMGWSETLSDIAAEADYTGRLNYKDAASGYMGFRGGWLHNGEMRYNSPCQEEGHYYLMIQEDANSGLPAWTMVHGNNLYNTFATDLHHYMKITREQAINTYLPHGRRVVRMIQGTCYTEQGEMVSASVENPLYFLDVSQVVDYNGGWILSTCAPAECQTGDRLAKSQDFMNTLVTQIQAMNPANKIAYVPFWGDVPRNGAWSNASSMNEQNGLYTDNEGRMTYKNGVGRVDFTTGGQSVRNQIDNPFTYDGTNWSRAIQNAIELMNRRTDTDREKSTLVIFLTDGMPQGTAGKPIDVNNPHINGVNETAQLKNTEGVTVYACGVGVNERDQTDLTARLNQIDSTGNAVKVRYNHQFEELKSAILNRMNEQYVIDIKGQDAFYTDTLSEPFTLDESKLDNTWKVLSAQGKGTTKGVPTDVYQAAKAGARVVYVRSTKTVYWHIGDMTDGTYSASGHEISFPVKYADYHKSTAGQDQAIESNTVQKLTYVTTKNPEQVVSKSMETPSIIFNRQDKPGITINKTVSGASFQKDQSYRFVYSEKKQSGGKITDYIGEINVTVKAGETTGSAAISDVAPGIYYIYEVDQEDRTISPQVEMVKVTESAELITVEAGDRIPLSAQSSDGAVLPNLDNVLRITTQGGSVSFRNEYVKADVAKIWKDENYAKRPKEVTVHLLRNGTEIQSMKLSETGGWKGAFLNLEKYAPDGSTYEYSITEDAVIGYESHISRTAENVYTITNQLLYGTVKLKKLDADGKNPLQGAVFELKKEDDGAIVEKTTDEKGEVVFEKLYPGSYLITEVKTKEGHTLLKEPLRVEVPKQVTEAEMKELGTEKENCVYYPASDAYLLYDYIYEITNHAAFAIPMTGGSLSAWSFVPLALGMSALLGAAFILLRKRR